MYPIHRRLRRTVGFAACAGAAASVCGAAARQLVEHRLMHGAADFGRAGCVHLGHRRIGTHPSGIGAPVAVEDPLVVLSRRERNRAATIAQREQGQLLALQMLLDHDAFSAETALDQQLLERLPCLGFVGGDRNALTRR